MTLQRSHAGGRAVRYTLFLHGCLRTKGGVGPTWTANTQKPQAGAEAIRVQPACTDRQIHAWRGMLDSLLRNISVGTPNRLAAKGDN